MRSSLLVGRRIGVYRQITVIDKPARHWWQLPTTHGEWKHISSGEVVDRASDSAEYLVAHDDGHLEWHWYSNLRIEKEN